MAESSHETGNSRTLTSVSELFPAGKPDGSVLVYGPAMSGKRRLGLELLAATEESDMRVYISPTEDASQVRNALAAATNRRVSESALVIGCHGDERAERTATVDSPGDLLGIAGEIARVYADAERQERVGSRLFIDDLSTLLLHTDVEAVTRFLHPVIRKVESSGGILVATLGTDGLEQAERQAILGLFDDRIEVRTEGNQSASCRLDSSETWYRFDPLPEGTT